MAKTLHPSHPLHPANVKRPVLDRWQTYLDGLENDARRYEELTYLAQHVLGMTPNLKATALMRELCETPLRDGQPRGWEKVAVYILTCANGSPSFDKEDYLRAAIRRMEQGKEERREQNRPQARGAKALARAEAEASATMRDPQYQWLNREKPAWWKD